MATALQNIKTTITARAEWQVDQDDDEEMLG